MEPDKKNEETVDVDPAKIANSANVIIRSYIGDGYVVATQTVTSSDDGLTHMTVHGYNRPPDAEYESFIGDSIKMASAIKRWYGSGEPSWQRPCPFYCPGVVIEIEDVGTIVISIAPRLSGTDIRNLDEELIAEHLVEGVEVPSDVGVWALVCLKEVANESFARSEGGNSDWGALVRPV